jgi:hypothetical protein
MFNRELLYLLSELLRQNEADKTNVEKRDGEEVVQFGVEALSRRRCTPLSRVAVAYPELFNQVS